MSHSTLPHRILRLVSTRREYRRQRFLVDDVRQLLRQSLHAVHRAMCSSNLRSLRKNARKVRELYTSGLLASRVFQAAYDGTKDDESRLSEISRIITESLGHTLGVLRACQHELYKRITGLITVHAV